MLPKINVKIKDEKFSLFNIPKPNFSNPARNWEQTNILIDNTPHTVYFDTNLGAHYYLQLDQNWYCAPTRPDRHDMYGAQDIMPFIFEGAKFETIS